jgi:putative ABC transport system permease protein
MIKNYITIAWRNLLRNRVTSAINIFGLTIGLTCFTLIALYIQYEASYDRDHVKADRIYRIAQQQAGNVYRGTDRFTGTPSVLSPTLRRDFPEVEATTTLQLYTMPMEKDGHVFPEQGLFSDEYLFDVFTFPIQKGIGKEALRDPDAILLTAALAKKYFGNDDPIGKTLMAEGQHLLTVKGILEDVPKNQHFSFDFITSFRNLPFYEEDRWNSNNFITYIVLPRGHDAKKFEEKLGSLDQYTKESYAGLPFKPTFFLQPLRDIHLHSQINFELGANNDISNIWLFASIAFVILLLASVNYMNLATATSALRAKEVGMRKALGAQKYQLVYQFLGESFLLTVISFVVALALVNMLLPSFSLLLDKPIPFTFRGNYWILTGMLAAAASLAGLSGLYPAMFLAAMRPAKAIKGNFLKSERRGSVLRNILVVGQFTVSIVLAIGSIVIYQQLQFVQSKKLGYTRENVVYIPNNDAGVSDKFPTIRIELLKNPQIEKVTFSSEIPLNMGSEGLVTEWEGNDSKQHLYIYRNQVDYDFLDLFEIELLEGRNFSPDHPGDSVGKYLLNESAVKALGWTSAVGKRFSDGEVIGVVRDFHFQPLDLTIQPLCINFLSRANERHNDIAVKIRMERAEETTAYILRTLKNISPHTPFDCRFLESDYAQLYDSEKRLGHAFNIFTALALFIACMGLVGLVSHHIIQRTKEIGIRKVLGATVGNIVNLISKDFLRLVLAAIIIAAPIAFWTMNKWLEDFAYKIEIEWWTFVLAGVAAISVALLTISVQSIKAALMNPVKSLRSE